MWVSAYCGIGGNEMADTLARSALVSDGFPHAGNLVFSFLTHPSVRLMLEWQRRWDFSDETKGCFLHSFKARVDLSPWFKHLAFDGRKLYYLPI